MSGEPGIVPRRRLQGVHEAPIEAKEMDVRDRITPHRPFLAAQSSFGDFEDFFPPFNADPARRMDCCGDKGHPRYRLRFGFEAAFGPETGLGIALGEIIE